jgi:hypothetical protein
MREQQGGHDLRWPDDDTGATERKDEQAEKSALDRLPPGAIENDSIIGGYFVDRVRGWRERLRDKRAARK